MSREFFVPCQPYAYPCGSGASEGVVSGVVSGMDCMPLRPGPFHYLISEQAKSLVALQELQNEVGALLEFRDLVIETFPNLRHKMAVTAAASAATGASSAGNGNASVLSQGSHIPLPLSSQSPSSRRIGEWEPGKVRRRVAQSRENESSSSSLPRSRSNSHSGGNKHSATVQDSGFSTETSSKDSASTAIPRPQSPGGRPALDEADDEDELWNLLDVIHRKGVRLREEVESLQGRLESVAPEELDVPSDILEAVRNVTRRRHSAELDEQHEPLREHQQHRLHHHSHDGGLDSRDDDLLLGEAGSQVMLLQHEKLQLLDKVAELEAETISSRARAQELQAELATLSALRSGLEDRLRVGLEAADGGILAPGVQRLQPIEPTAPTAGSHLLQSPRASGAALSRSRDSAFASVVAGTASGKAHKNRFRTRTIEKNVLVNVAAVSRSIEDVRGAVASSSATASVNERRARLGALDSVLISPTRTPPGQVRRGDVDERKIAAILRERSPLELQRHLITTTVHNQVLQKRLDAVEKSSETLSERLGKVHEENEDLRFQLAERNIELEGTRARVRVLERLQQRPATENDADDESEPAGPLHNGHQHNGLDISSSSSADTSRDALSAPSGPQPLANHHDGPLKPSPRRRPSRIPLLGATKAAAPKPPTTAGHRRTDSRDSLKSLGAPGRAASIPSAGRPAKPGRDSSRESLGKGSLPRGQAGGREPASRSLPRSAGGRDSLGRQSAGPASQRPQQARDSPEAAGPPQPPGTPPRRPPAPARRAQSQAGRPSSASVAEAAGADSGKSMLSENPPSSWLSSGVSYYPDSLNSLPHNTGSHNNTSSQAAEDEDDETSSRTASTRVEFIIGSPTRKRFFRTPWAMPRYFDSIDTEGIMQESFESDEYSLRRGEGLAECDSLECSDRLDSES